MSTLSFATSLYRRRHLIPKRLLDLTVGLLVLPFALIAMLSCAIAIVLDSPGPVFFVQHRVGKGGRCFKLYKFRTLCHDCDTKGHRAFMKAFVNGEVATSKHGKVLYKPFRKREVTRVGRWLRRTSLDELPQLVNVIKGEMSLVGPRPNVVWEVEEYEDWHKERLEVLPGITGLAQVRGRSGISFNRIVKYDIEYIENRSLKLDLQILWWTVVTVLAGIGAH